MAITVAGFVATLGSLSVSGVTARTSPPQQTNAADLPLGFPRIPQTGAEMSTFGGIGGLRSVSCEYVILINPIMHDTDAVNIASAIAAMDNLHTALTTEMTTNKQIDRWSMRLDEVLVGSTSVYWAVIATVEASE